MIICILVYKEGNQLMEWKSYKDIPAIYSSSKGPFNLCLLT